MKCKAFILVLLTAIPGLVSAATDCSEDVLFKFFPRKFVMEVLDEHNVPQEKANNIADALYEADQIVVQVIGSKANAMESNPLEDPQAEKERAKLFNESLSEVFTDILEENGVTDQAEVKEMLDEIQQMRNQRFNQCRKENRLPDLPIEDVNNE